jgi:hypothetical protein
VPELGPTPDSDEGNMRVGFFHSLFYAAMVPGGEERSTDSGIRETIGNVLPYRSRPGLHP